MMLAYGTSIWGGHIRPLSSIELIIMGALGGAGLAMLLILAEAVYDLWRSRK
jgi:hypothetical protein